MNKFHGINDTPHGWSADKTNRKIYDLWFRMLRRCYDEKSTHRSRGSSYIGCSVCDDWLYLSKFANDVVSLDGYETWLFGGNMVLDKDSIACGNREYKKDACCFIDKKESIREMNRRHPEFSDRLRESNKRAYRLTKGNEVRIFGSEIEACMALGVTQCTVACCRARGTRCRGYSVEYDTTHMERSGSGE